MFSSLSFKKLRRRIRAITLFKKFAKKSNSKEKVSKHQDNKLAEDIEQRQVDVASVVEAAASPEVVVPSESSVDASSGTEPSGPLTPTKADQILVENAVAAKQNLFVVEHEDVAAAQNTTYSKNSKPALTERPAQITTQDPLDMHLKNAEFLPRDYVQPIGSVGDEDDVAQVQKAPSLHDPEPIFAKSVIQDVETVRVIRVDGEMSKRDVVEDRGPLALEKPVQGAETDGKDSKRGDVKKPLGTGPLSSFPDADCTPSPVDTELYISPVDSSGHSTTEVGGVLVHTSVPSSHETPSSADTVQVHTPCTNPRKRVASEVRENQDPSILSELQASVRSREKRRLEKERIEAEQKKTEERELRQSVAATMGMEFTVTEQGVWTTDDPVERENILREVRSWRKQREASLKGNVDQSAIAKAAAFREALSNEAIMVDLMSTVQSRASRASCFIDPREKRQTLLEELFARRVCVGRG